MGIIAWIIVGLIAGALAKLIMPGDDPGGIIVTILIGIVGAFVGGFVFNLFGGAGVSGFNIWSILVATVGAIILLLIYRLVAGPVCSNAAYGQERTGSRPMPDPDVYCRGTGGSSHAGSRLISTSEIHFTQPYPRWPGATSLKGKPCPTESTSPPTWVARRRLPASSSAKRRA